MSPFQTFIYPVPTHSLIFAAGANKHDSVILSANYFYLLSLPSVLWHWWLSGRKGIWPVKNRVVGFWHGYLSGARCRFAYGPPDATATHYLLLK